MIIAMSFENFLNYCKQVCNFTFILPHPYTVRVSALHSGRRSKAKLLHEIGNYTQTIQYFDQTLVMNPNSKESSTNKEKAQDALSSTQN